MGTIEPTVLTRNLILKTERNRRGWTQAQLANVLGVATKTVIRWERGLTVPQPSHRKQLGMLFGKTAQELGLLWDAHENHSVNMVEQAPYTFALKAIPEVPMQVSLRVDTAPQQTLGAGNSLLGRAELLSQVKKRLLDTDSLHFIALYGSPGVGKTTLAMELARDRLVQEHFGDGILQVPLGRLPHVLGQLTCWGGLLGVAPTDVGNPQSCRSWGRRLQSAIGARRMLLIIDDAWAVEDALALQIGGAQCSCLLTTCQFQVAQAFARQEAILVPQLEEADGVALLARYVPRLVQQDPQGVQSLVQVLNCLPLALTLMGKYLASSIGTANSWPLRVALAQLYDIQELLSLSMRTTPEQGRYSLAKMASLSLYATVALCDQQLSSQAQTALRALAIFPPKPHCFSEEAALAVSQQPIETLDELCGMGLLEHQEARSYNLHQAIVDYVHIGAKF